MNKDLLIGGICSTLIGINTVAGGVILSIKADEDSNADSIITCITGKNSKKRIAKIAGESFVAGGLMGTGGVFTIAGISSIVGAFKTK